jgi:hypothetical protein
VVYAIAQQVDQRIAEAVDDRLVEFRVSAHDHELRLAAKLAGEVTHEAPELPERRSDRHHPDIQARIARLFAR